MDTPAAPERNNRSAPDRRRRPTPSFSRYVFFGGRRRGRRRASDPEHYYVDRLGAEVWLVLLLVFLFQILDANLTLALLRKGGIELNPIMARLIEHNVFAFYLIKLGVSAVGLWFLGIHKNYPWVRPGLAILFLLFLGVICWHCFLIFSVI